MVLNKDTQTMPSSSPDDRSLSRRQMMSRAFSIAAGVMLVPSLTSPAAALTTGTDSPVWRWRGAALGAMGSLDIQHPDEAFAKQTIAEVVSEVARLEKIFSLYRPDSAVSVLNRTGALTAPPAELVMLLGTALRFARISEGHFDPTIQPVWQVLRDHFSDPAADPQGPSSAVLSAARARVDWTALDVGTQQIRFGREGMAITLNGIAQGYISDRVGDLLRRRGLTHVMINLGETVALGPKADGQDWTLGIAGPDGAAGSGQSALRLPIRSGAMATSGGYGTRFSADGRFNHLIDARDSLSPAPGRSVTVLARTATEADALSTLLALKGADPVRQTQWLAAVPGARAVVVDAESPGGRWLVG